MQFTYVPYTDGKEWTLDLNATGMRDDAGRAQFAYKLISPEGETIFEGSDYHAHTRGDNDEEVAGGLLSFLTLRPGDTDAEYFDNYTPRQWEFVETDAEALSMWAADLEETARA